MTVFELAAVYDALHSSYDALNGVGNQPRGEGGYVHEFLEKEIERTWHNMAAVADEMARREPRESDPHEVVEFSRVVLDWYMNKRGEDGEGLMLTAARGVLELRRRQARRKLKAA